MFSIYISTNMNHLQSDKVRGARGKHIQTSEEYRKKWLQQQLELLISISVLQFQIAGKVQEEFSHRHIWSVAMET